MGINEESEQILLDDNYFLVSRFKKIEQINELLKNDSANHPNHKKLFQRVRGYTFKEIKELIRLNTEFEIDENKSSATYSGYIKKLIDVMKQVYIPNNLNSIIKNLFIDSIRQGYINSIKLLLQIDVNINIQDEDGSNAVIAIIKCGGSIPILQTLIEHNADVNHADKNGQTALIHAVRMNRLALVQELLKHNIDIDVCDQDGKNALVYAFESESLFTVELSHKSAEQNKAMIEDRQKALQILEELLKYDATLNGVQSFDITNLTSQNRTINSKHPEYTPPEDYFCDEKLTKALLIIKFLNKQKTFSLNEIANLNKKNEEIIDLALTAINLVQDPNNLTLKHILGLDDTNDLFTNIFEYYIDQSQLEQNCILSETELTGERDG